MIYEYSEYWISFVFSLLLLPVVPIGSTTDTVRWLLYGLSSIPVPGPRKCNFIESRYDFYFVTYTQVTIQQFATRTDHNNNNNKYSSTTNFDRGTTGSIPYLLFTGTLDWNSPIEGLLYE